MEKHSEPTPQVRGREADERWSRKKGPHKGAQQLQQTRDQAQMQLLRWRLSLPHRSLQPQAMVQQSNRLDNQNVPPWSNLMDTVHIRRVGRGKGGKEGRWRRQKLYWQQNDNWQVPTWASIGWYTPAYLSIFACISTEIGRQYRSTPVFLKIRTLSFQKVRKSWCEQYKFIASEADRRVLVGSYCSFTLAYFKPFPDLKYTAGPDWSKKFVKPMNIEFASKLYGS